MAVNDASDRLIGNDGAVYITDGNPVEIKTPTQLTEGFYKVIAKNGDSGLTGIEVGDYFYCDGTHKPSLTGEDTVICVVDLTKQAEDTSIKGFEISLTKDKIELTTMADTMKTYRMGKADASGTMNGVTTVKSDVVKNKFMDVLNVDGEGAFTMKRQNNKPVYFVGFLNADKDIANGTLVAVVGRVDIESGNLGATVGNAQEFSAGFAPFSGDKLMVINIDAPAEA